MITILINVTGDGSNTRIDCEASAGEVVKAIHIMSQVQQSFIEDLMKATGNKLGKTTSIKRDRK